MLSTFIIAAALVGQPNPGAYDDYLDKRRDELFIEEERLAPSYQEMLERAEKRAEFKSSDTEVLIYRDKIAQLALEFARLSRSYLDNGYDYDAARLRERQAAKWRKRTEEMDAAIAGRDGPRSDWAGWTIGLGLVALTAVLALQLVVRLIPERSTKWADPEY